ncbi:MAG TPA: serine hydrolase [Desulfobacteria bacterium]|nr:serine hydrolase [Desulfobacteria bacterium]
MNFRPDNIIAEFERCIRHSMKDWRVPGMSVAIVSKGSPVYVKGFGVKTLGCSDKVDEHTVFQTGSVSKSFTSALISMLVDEGKLSWSDKVRDYLPDFRLHDPVITSDFRIEDLMSQRSGLPPHSGRLLPHLGFTGQDIIKKLYLIKPTFSFRKDYTYQNNLFLIAAALIEKRTGKSWFQNLAAKILNPLGMKHTTATLEGYLGSGRGAWGHYYDGPGPESPIKTLPKSWPHHDWVYTVAPAGGINSTALDMANWLLFNTGEGMFRNKRLISEKEMRFLHTPKVAAGMGVWGESRYYCQGWVLSQYSPYPILWHNGGTSGMKSMAALIPKAGVGIVVLCNLYESLLPEALSRIFLDMWFGNPRRDWNRELLDLQKARAEALGESPAPHLRPRPLKFYTGEYYNELYGPLTVSKSEGALTITLGPKKIRLALKHWGGDTFVLYWPGVLTNGAGVQFYSGRAGIVDKLTIEGMNDDVGGTFNRRFTTNKPKEPRQP